jgi:predicted RNase H-like HicB family nuclease
MTPYLRTVFYSQEDGGYIAEAPDLEYCSAFAETAEEALAELENVMKAWLQTAKENGKTVPAPSRTRLSTGTTDSSIYVHNGRETDYSGETKVDQEVVHA